MTKRSWDVFIAYASPNRNEARRIWEGLSRRGLRVFFDAERLQPGDDFAAELPRAQHASKITIALVSRHTEHACYQREEIANAVEWARANPVTHRLVPVYLDGRPTGRSAVPYGLRTRHALDVNQLGFETTVGKIADLVTHLRSKEGSSAAHIFPSGITAAPEDEQKTAVRRANDILHGVDLLHWSNASKEVVQAARTRAEQELNASTDLREGGVVALRFILMRPLGIGGFATVWLAYDRESLETVALKFLHPHIRHNEDNLRRFIRGVRHSRELFHTNVVRVLDGPNEWRGLHFAVLEYIDGQTLEDRLREKGPLSEARTVAVLKEMAEALTYAHRAGVVHRDIKPSNILIEKHTERALLADFDMARQQTHNTTHACGTLPFISPETLRDHKQSTTQSDIYSLGITGLVCLADAEDMHIDELLSQPANALERLPVSADLKTVLGKAVDRDPRTRYHDAAQLRTALQSLPTVPTATKSILDLDIEAQPPARTHLLSPTSPRLRWVGVAVLAVGAIYLAILGYESFTTSSAPTTTAEADRLTVGGDFSPEDPAPQTPSETPSWWCLCYDSYGQKVVDNRSTTCRETKRRCEGVRRNQGRKNRSPSRCEEVVASHPALGLPKSELNHWENSTPLNGGAIGHLYRYGCVL